jgi:hypothetical protein
MRWMALLESYEGKSRIEKVKELTAFAKKGTIIFSLSPAAIYA